MSHPCSEIVTPEGDGIDCDGEVSEDSDFSDFESDEFEEESTALQGRLHPSTNHPGHRGERVRELVATELEYVHDLELLTGLTIGDAVKDKYNVLDMKVLLGNMAEVISVARRFLQELKDVAHQKEEEMVIGKIFLQFVDELSDVYKVYCSSYNVDVLPLLKKYENEENTSIALKQLAEELRLHKQHLLDINSVLIKPVQRILKYPLYLYELVQATPESHRDFSDLEEAKKSFLVAAKDINEYTRAMDLVHKYREVDHSLHGKMRRINLHSLARKSVRVTRKLSQRFGVPHQAKTLNSEVKELGIKFRTVQKASEILVKNVTSLVDAVRNRHSTELVIAELLVDIFPEAAEALKVKATVMESCNKALQLFDNEVQQRVLHPARQILILCEGPANVIQKTRKIMVDYDMAQLKLQAALEPSRIALVIEESAGIRGNYEALTKQLVAELPVFIDQCVAVLTICTQSLISAHMYLQGHLAKLYLQLTQEPGLSYLTPEEAENKAKQRVENLLQALPNAYQRKHISKKKEIVKKPEKSEQVELRDKSESNNGEPSRVSSSEFFKGLPSRSRGRSRRSSPGDSEQAADQIQRESRSGSRYEYFKNWSHSYRIRHARSLFSVLEGSEHKTEAKPLEDQYAKDVIFTVSQEHKPEGENELTLQTGDKVAVLKRKDPMGGEDRWVVDNGEKIGMVRKVCLQLAEFHVVEDRLDDTCHDTDTSSTFQSPSANNKESAKNESSHRFHQEFYPNHEHLVAPTSQQQSGRQIVNAPFVSHNNSNHEENLSSSSEEWYEDVKTDENNLHVAQDVQCAKIDCQTGFTPSEQYIVLYNFTAADPSQLTIKKGQVVVGIHTEYPDWWYVKDDYGFQGYVPASYLVLQR
ncbi:rho guanine nucleotide exchange factor 38-like [Palaemon carinicauda]|uniref:rho guanine nucleotide exchange factor 38-like n=1 Tax=Palaemon carinicauda TaxID=392227 RepID=UPI0035B5EDE6